MTYTGTTMGKLKQLIEEATGDFERASASKILAELEGNRSAAADVSSNLLTSVSSPEKFSDRYKEFIRDYDVRKVIDEGASFGRILTVVVNMDTEKSHQVQLCEGVSEDDFGGLDKRKNYNRFEILMNYPSDAKIIDYIKQRFMSQFPTSEVVS